ncbi:putative oxidoreductase C24B10.20 [Grifola frondosa]|uniref:Putative oxidoreductase C24B10.20 n=1 Tax=Grifola frondosa TaxID=5627 RepID=A0A1C7M8T8_GRIFR|nr:putative oxidoreductase C24B10.20 [Grifola frondosa]
MLPLTLLAVVQTHLSIALAQTSQHQLQLSNGVYNFSTTSLPSPPTFALPDISTLYVSVAVCSTGQYPRFFVTNDTSISQPGPGDVDDSSVFEISLGAEGVGTWNGTATHGGVLAIYNSPVGASFQVGISDVQDIFNITDTYPLLGDTASNQALLFSPPFSPITYAAPTYPNYTLPPANLTFPPAPSSPPNYSLYIVQTSSSSLSTMPRTACAIRNSRAAGATLVSASSSQGLWLRDDDGWRWQWLVGGLTPLTNYTAFAVQDQTKVSQPINFVTKSAAFICPIVHSLPFCPSTGYAVPLPPPPDPATGHNAQTIPADTSATMLAILANFTTTLTTLACGRDEYSPLVSCADCQRAYRTWLCAAAFPRCAEEPSALDTQAGVPAALVSVPAGAAPRNTVLPAFAQAYVALLPCLETCNAADRACPSFLGFKCPLPQFTAAQSYGVGYVDSGEQGVMGGGVRARRKTFMGTCGAIRGDVVVVSSSRRRFVGAALLISENAAWLADARLDILVARTTVAGDRARIGLEFVRQLSADQNNIVFGLVRNKSTATTLADLQRERPNVHVVQADIVDSKALKAAAAEVAKVTGGSLDYLINNAAFVDDEKSGLTLDRFPSEEVLEKELQKSFTINVIGVVHTTNAFLPLLRAGRTKKVVALSTGLADVELTLVSGFAVHAPYSISKVALNMAVAKYAAEFRGEGFVFLAVSPGLVNTKQSPPTPEELELFKGMVADFKKAAPEWDGNPISPEQSVRLMLGVVDRATVADTGAFVSHFGNKRWL